MKEKGEHLKKVVKTHHISKKHKAGYVKFYLPKEHIGKTVKIVYIIEEVSR